MTYFKKKKMAYCLVSKELKHMFSMYESLVGNVLTPNRTVKSFLYCGYNDGIESQHQKVQPWVSGNYPSRLCNNLVW